MILITGASGNVGSEVLKQTAAAGLDVRAACLSADRASAAPRGVETIVLDYQKPETIRQALRGIDTVFLVGPPTSNLPELEANVVDEAKNARIRSLVKLSALGG